MNWKDVAGVAIRLISVIVPHIEAIESAANALGGAKGKQKEDAVMVLVKEVLETADQVSQAGLGDPAVDTAIREVIQAYVALQNALAAAKAARPAPQTVQ